jgi:NADH-quinone oxidoreductase subunit G
MLIVQAISAATNAPFAMLTEGANSAGISMAGAVPQRGGASAVQALTTKPKRAYILVNVEPEFDCAYAAKAVKQLDDAGLVICLTPFKTAAMEKYADFILPVAPFTESGGTYVNVTGEWQTVAPASVPEDGCQPAWKVLRALANFIELDGFDYKTREAVLDEVKQRAQTLKTDMQFEATDVAEMDGELVALPYTHMYRTDNLVRRADALQAVILPEDKAVQVHSATAAKLGLQSGDMVVVNAPQHSAEFLLTVNDDVAVGTVVVPVAMNNAVPFNPAFCTVTLSRGN